MSKLHQFFLCTLPVAVARFFSSGGAIRYIQYFRFCGWRHDFLQWALNIGDDFSTTGRNLVSFGPVTLEFTRLVCVQQSSISTLASFVTICYEAALLVQAGLATRLALRRIFCLFY